MPYFNDSHVCYGVAFSEAATAFGDPLSLTVPDPVHSAGEARFIHIGLAYLGRLVVVAHLESDDSIRIISARSATRAERRFLSKKADSSPPSDMLAEYDFSDAVRGKYAERFAEGSNVIVLDPDVAEVFNDATAVNSALRLLAESARSSEKAS